MSSETMTVQPTAIDAALLPGHPLLELLETLETAPTTAFGTPAAIVLGDAFAKKAAAALRALYAEPPEAEARIRQLEAERDEIVRGRDEAIARALNQADVEAERAGNALNDKEALEASLKQAMAREKVLTEALETVRDRIIVGLDDTFWMSQAETVVDYINAVLTPARAFLDTEGAGKP